MLPFPCFSLFALAVFGSLRFNILAHCRCEIAQSLLLCRRKLFGHNDVNGHELISATAGAQRRYSLALEAELCACLRTFWYIQLNISVQSRHLNLRSKRSRRKRYVLLKQY